jgi:dTDP-4-dehydrorhamnose reductase
MNSEEATILVFGRTGQLAQCLIEAGAEAAIRVTALGRPGIDLLDVDSLHRAVERHRPDLVVNVAAYTAVDRAETDEAAAFAVNAEGAENAARAAAAFGCPIVHLSTDYVFDGTKDAPYTEADAPSPESVYGRSKLEGEQRVASVCARHLVLRTAWVHSPFGNNFVKTMLRLAETREVVRVVDDQCGSPTYAPHLADAILAVPRQLSRGDEAAAAPWGVYHIAGQGEATWCALAREVFARSKRLGGASAEVEAIPSSEYPTPAVRPVNSRLDCARFRDVFGFGLPTWQVGVAECVGRLAGGEGMAGERPIRGLIGGTS